MGRSVKKGKESNLPLQAKEAPNLIANIEQIVNLAVKHNLDEEFYAAAEPYLAHVAKRMNLTVEQALVFSLFMEKSSGYIQISDFSELVGCRNIRVIAMMAEAEELAKRQLIRQIRSGESMRYRVPFEVVAAVKENRVYIPEPIDHLTPERFFDRMDKIFEEADDDRKRLLEELNAIVAANPQLQFCKTLKRYAIHDDDDRLLFYVFCNLLVNRNDDMIGEQDWEDYFRKSTVRYIRIQLEGQNHLLQERKIIENINNDGIGSSAYFHFTARAKEELFAELHLVEQQTKNRKELIDHKTFAPKVLFYNSCVQSQIDQLASVLEPEHFASIQQRLEAGGLRKGFACLFYGSPGTGKTETVYQIARRTERDVMVIDASQIKSCWVGESEKNIKAAFDRYRAYVKQLERTPILLFNEADAVLGIRQEGAERAVDKMENSIQNIILQEMEQLDGIMIATTNLTQNLDKAFERRFLYKIEFETPSPAAKRAIWQSLIPRLDDSLAALLAERYDFSGGQIENIARKWSVAMILYGAEPSVEQLHDYCRAELISTKKPSGRRIGY